MPNILVVERSPDIRALMSVVLTRAGYAVNAVPTAAAAAALLAAGTAFTVALIDYEWPDPAGVALLRDLRAGGHRVPVLLVCGGQPDGLAPDLLDGPLVGILPKPFTVSGLVHAVEAIAPRG